jgi:hypothetical protein
VNHSPVDSAERCGGGRAQRDPSPNDLALATVSDNVSQARQWRALGDEKKTRSRPRVGDPTPGLRKDVFERSHASDKTNIAKRKMVVEEKGGGGVPPTLSRDQAVVGQDSRNESADRT